MQGIDQLEEIGRSETGNFTGWTLFGSTRRPYFKLISLGTALKKLERAISGPWSTILPCTGCLGPDELRLKQITSLLWLRLDMSKEQGFS